jgi:hypothetical protein
LVIQPMFFWPAVVPWSSLAVRLVGVQPSAVVARIQHARARCKHALASPHAWCHLTDLHALLLVCTRQVLAAIWGCHRVRVCARSHHHWIRQVHRLASRAVGLVPHVVRRRRLWCRGVVVGGPDCGCGSDHRCSVARRWLARDHRWFLCRSRRRRRRL